MELQIKHVSKKYGRNAPYSLQDTNLTLQPDIIGLLGPNGAGKSTMMNVIATLLEPSAGQVLWNGVDISKNPDALRLDLGYLPQDFGVYPHLTAVEFLQYLAALKGVPRRAAKQGIEELLHLVNLTEAGNRPIGVYSGGMRQRVGIAQAVLDYAPPGTRLICSCGWHITLDGQDVYSRSLKMQVTIGPLFGRLFRVVDIDDQVEACRRIFASDTLWTVVRGSDLEEGESQGLPVWSTHVGDPILASNMTRWI